MVAAMVAGVAIADDVAKTAQQTAAQLRDGAARAMEKRMRRTGGFLRRPDALDGKIVILDAQKTVPVGAYTNVLPLLNMLLRAPVEARTIAKPASVDTATDLLKSENAAVGVFVIDDTSMKVPMLVAPEAKWAIVNLAWLKAGEMRSAFVQSRMLKEVTRALMIVCGGANSTYEGSLMKAVVKPTDLDDLVNANPPIDVAGRTTPYLPALGVSPNPMTSYRVACREGWAPQPTNEYQKAIWDEFHTKPTEPIKIKKNK